MEQRGLEGVFLPNRTPPRRGDIFLAVGTTHGTVRGRKKGTQIRPLGRKKPAADFQARMSGVADASSAWNEKGFPSPRCHGRR